MRHASHGAGETLNPTPERLLRAVYGDEVVTQTASFDRALGRLGRLTAYSGSDSPANLAYQVAQTFDDDGRVATREYGHQLPALKAHHSFAYDGLGRLSEWKLGPTANQQERTTYAFTVAGNLDAVNHYDAADVLQSAEPYGYKLEQPHLVDTKGPWSFSYDGEGRRVESFNGGQHYASFNYDSFDKPASGTVGRTSFSSVRDAAGTRLLRTVGADSTLFIGGLYERRQTGTDPASHVFKVVAGGEVVATVTFDEGESNETLRYHLSGPLGSSAMTFKDDGTVEDELQFSPYGQRRNEDWTAVPVGVRPSVLNEGFTGHIHDDVLGLIDMRGRSYDPVIRQFLTLDPMADFEASGRGLGRTGYVGWDPLNLVDPSGFQSQPSGGHWEPDSTYSDPEGQYEVTVDKWVEDDDILEQAGTAVTRPNIPLGPSRPAWKRAPFGLSNVHRQAPAVPFCTANSCHQPGRLSGATSPDTTRAHLTLIPLYIAGGMLGSSLLPVLSSGEALLGATATLPFTVEGHTGSADNNLKPAFMVLSLGIGGGSSVARHARQLAASVEDEAALVRAALSIRERGPVISGVLDTRSGVTWYALNTGVPARTHPILARRLARLLEETSGVGLGKGIPGEHAEFVALNEALFARQAAGEAVSETSLADFLIYNERLRGAASGQFIVRCPNCTALTQGARGPW